MQSNRSALVAILLCFFFGCLGVHRFYVGKNGTGILMLLTLGGLGLWQFIDFIIIATGTFTDKNGNELHWDAKPVTPMKIKTKICGLKTPEAVKAAEDNGAEFLGFIFYPKSPRYLSLTEAGILAKTVTHAKKVAVVVDVDDALLEAITAQLKPNYIQLHGNESDERAAAIKAKFGLPLIRARHPDNVQADDLYDFLLIDTPSQNYGGSGVAFDWAKFTPPKQGWFLSGGLNVDNIAEAVKTTGASMVDISSGVESAPGVKDLAKIIEFLKAVNELK